MSAEPSGWTPGLSRAYWAVAGVLVLVVVGCGVGAVVSGAVPTSDDALLAVRARDVFSARPPLLSIGSSGGVSSGTAYNQPGAAALWFAAPFVAALGGVGVALAAAVLNACCLGASAWLLRRAARPALAAGVLAALAGLAWGMGSTVLASPWNSNQATLPFALLLVGAWAVWSGVPAGGPLGMVGGALAAQTHLSFIPSSVAVVGLLLLGLVVAWRRADGPARTRWARAAAGSVAAGLVGGSLVLAEQLARGSDGNLSRLLAGGEFDVATLSVRDAAATLAAVLVRPPLFAAGSWDTSVYRSGLPGPTTTAVGLALLGVLVVVGALRARRRADRAVLAGLLVPVVALAAGAAASQTFPYRIGVPVPYFRWAWPSAALLLAALLVPALEAVVRRVQAGSEPVLVVSLLVLAAVGAAAAGLTRVEVFTGGTRWAEPLVDEVVVPVARQLAGSGPVEFVQSSQEAALSLSPSILLELPEQGVDVRTADPYLVLQVGERYRATGREPFVLVSRGPGVDDGPGRRLAATRPLRAEERAEARRLRRAGAGLLAAHPLQLTPFGRAVGDPATADLVAAARRDPESVASNRFLAASLRAGLLRAQGASPAEVRALERGAERLTELDGRTISYWVVPREDYRP
ncbi:MAG: hypothetical protein ACKO04_11710 [Actinomycetes bacterium]